MLNLFINCISTKLAAQILSLKDEYTFCFSNFLIIGLCNSSTNSWFNIILLLTAPLGNLFLVAMFSDRADLVEVLALEDSLSKKI